MNRCWILSESSYICWNDHTFFLLFFLDIAGFNLTFNKGLLHLCTQSIFVYSSFSATFCKILVSRFFCFIEKCTKWTSFSIFWTSLCMISGISSLNILFNSPVKIHQHYYPAGCSNPCHLRSFTVDSILHIINHPHLSIYHLDQW